MKKFLPILLSVIFINLSAESFDLGSKDLGIGIGLDNNLYGGSYGTSIPPISVLFDYGLNDSYGPGVISIGGIIGYSSIKAKWNVIAPSNGVKITYIFLGFRSAYHMQFVENLDTYAGLALHYVKPSITYYDENIPKNSSYSNADLSLALNIGAKYYFNERIGAFAELGLNSFSILNLGVCFKL